MHNTAYLQNSKNYFYYFESMCFATDGAKISVDEGAVIAETITKACLPADSGRVEMSPHA
jgi:hypothetical protein